MYRWINIKTPSASSRHLLLLVKYPPFSVLSSAPENNELGARRGLTALRDRAMFVPVYSIRELGCVYCLRNSPNSQPSTTPGSVDIQCINKCAPFHPGGTVHLRNLVCLAYSHLTRTIFHKRPQTSWRSHRMDIYYPVTHCRFPFRSIKLRVPLGTLVRPAMLLLLFPFA